MHGTKALAGAIHAGEELLGGFGGVPGLWGYLAVVAVAALVWSVVSKVVEQHFAAAAGDFAEPQHGVELVALGAFKLLGAI